MALTTSVRGTPSGIKLPDGFSSKIAFARNTTVSFWEMSVQPPGLDGGDPVETTTMFNTVYRTKTSRALKTMTPLTVKAAFDPRLYTQLIELINMEGAITQRFPDGSTLDFYGFLQKADFDALEEGKFPQVTITIVPTNQDPVTGAEVSAVLTEVTGS